MTFAFDKVSNLKFGLDSGKILVKVIRMWYSHELTNCKLPQCLELVVMDSQGSKIHISIKKTLIYKFEKILADGNVYSISGFEVVHNSGDYKTTRHQFKLNLQFHSAVHPMDNIAITADPYTFILFSDIKSPEFDDSFLVDIIGILSGVGSERFIRTNCRKTKMNVIEIDTDGCKLQCTLSGRYVDDLNNFMAAIDMNNVAVIIQFAKVKTVEGHITLNSINGATKMIFNPPGHLAEALKQKYAESPDFSMFLSHLHYPTNVLGEDDFLILTPRKTVSQIKKNNQDYFCIVLGTILSIDDVNWWYIACKCNYKVFPDEKMFFCEGCNRHVVTVNPRFRLHLRVSDHTGDAPVILFDKEASIIVGKTCVELVQLADKNEPIDGVPIELANLVGKEFLFKLEVQNLTSFKFDPLKYEPAFRVKRICIDEAIIRQFKSAQVENSVDAISSRMLTTRPSILQTSEVSKVGEIVDSSSKSVLETHHTESIDLNDDSQEVIESKRGSIVYKGSLSLNLN